MKNALIKLVSGVFILALTGCASVKFYSNSELTKKSGLKYYTVKPVLQVERELANNSIVKATILYLPDLENPQFIAVKDGLGSRKLDLKLTDGTINTFGSEIDPKIAETLTALSGLVSKTTSAITDLSIMRNNATATTSSTIIELYDIIINNGLTSVKRIEIK